LTPVLGGYVRPVRNGSATVQAGVAEGVHRVEDAYCNWYLVEEGDRVTVVDAGLPTSWDSLRAALLRIGRSLDDVAALVLTHAHFDHIGFAERARATLGIEVWAPEDDVPLTRHPLQYGRDRSPLAYAWRPGARGIMAAMVRNRAFFPPPIRQVRRYRPADGALPVPGQPVVCATPGHTLGHTALALPGRDAVIAGDAVVTLDPYTGERGPRLVARAATADPERAFASLDALARTEARVVLPGHGEPWREGVEAAVELAHRAGIA
jgi:glyoxylase-like metal-dependent hydrolase (beta-lactamase superfamily II)